MMKIWTYLYFLFVCIKNIYCNSSLIIYYLKTIFYYMFATTQVFLILLLIHLIVLNTQVPDFNNLVLCIINFIINLKWFIFTGFSLANIISKETVWLLRRFHNAPRSEFILCLESYDKEAFLARKSRAITASPEDWTAIRRLKAGGAYKHASVNTAVV